MIIITQHNIPSVDYALINPHNYELCFTTTTGFTLNEVGSEISLCINELDAARIGQAMLKARKQADDDEHELLRIERDS